MTERDETPPPETNPDGSPKKDLRYSEQSERNVRINRDLDGSGRLARGDRTHMSVLNFSSRHQARTERDPDFEFRPPPEKPRPPEPPPPVAAAPEAPVASEPTAPVEAPAPEATPTLVDKVKNFLGL